MGTHLTLLNRTAPGNAMGGLMVMVALVGAPLLATAAPATVRPKQHLALDRAGTRQLMAQVLANLVPAEGERFALAVVSDDDLVDALVPHAQATLQEALRKQPRTRNVVALEGVMEWEDSDLAEHAAAQGLNRIIRASVTPSTDPPGSARLEVAVLDEAGRELARAASPFLFVWVRNGTADTDQGEFESRAWTIRPLDARDAFNMANLGFLGNPLDERIVDGEGNALSTADAADQLQDRGLATEAHALVFLRPAFVVATVVGLPALSPLVWLVAAGVGAVLVAAGIALGLGSASCVAGVACLVAADFCLSTTMVSAAVTSTSVVFWRSWRLTGTLVNQHNRALAEGLDLDPLELDARFFP